MQAYNPNYNFQEQLPGETNAWYSRYLIYRNLGASRDLKETIRIDFARRRAAQQQQFKDNPILRFKNDAGKKLIEPKSVPKNWKEAAQKYQWEYRYAAYERYLQDQEDKKIVDARAALRSEEINLAGKLRDKALQMLAMPLAQRVEEFEDADGKHVVVYKPVKWTMADAAKMVELYSKLTRMGLEMPTSNIAVAGQINVSVSEEDRKIVDLIGQNPDAARLAYKLLEQLNPSQSDADRSSGDGE